MMSLPGTTRPIRPGAPAVLLRLLSMAGVAAVLLGTPAGPAGAQAQAQSQAQAQPRAGAPNGADAFELSFWDTIKNSTNPEDYKAYLEAFPNGRFAPLARIRARGAAPTTQVDPGSTTRPPGAPLPSTSPPPSGPRPSTAQPGGQVGGAQPPSVSAPPAGTPPAASAGSTPPDGDVEILEGDYVTTAATPIQASSEPGARRLGTLRAGEMVRVTGRLPGGRQLRILSADGRTGYVAADRLKPAEVPAAPATAGAGQPVTDCPDCPEMVPLPAGSFEMGANEFFEFEKPVHTVTLARGFLMGRREVTLREWQACVAAGGCPRAGAGASTDPNHPVTDVTWSEARGYAEWLSRRSGKRYRLPTEAEWEYAARAGTKMTYPWGPTLVRERATCQGCNATPVRQTTPVGSYPANGFGLFDMAGNAAEWVEDCWFDSYKGAPADGSARLATPCRERVLRGGAFANDPRYLRSAARFKYDAEVRYYANGFRVARDE